MSEEVSAGVVQVETPNGPSQVYEQVPLHNSRHGAQPLSNQRAPNESSETAISFDPASENAQRPPIQPDTINSAPQVIAEASGDVQRPPIRPEMINSAAQVVAEASENVQRPLASIASEDLHSSHEDLHSSHEAIAQPNTTRQISKKSSKAAHTSSRRFVAGACSLLWPIAATILVVVVASITLSADSPNWPLTRITPPMGVFLLTIFSKLTDFFFEWAADTVWEKMQWGPLMKGGEKLLTFLILSSGLGGCRKILFLPHGDGRRNSPRGMKNVIDFFRSSPRMWSLIRIISWASIQFPGVIIMTIVNPQTSYVPVNWTEISGGLGIYDPNMVRQGVSGSWVSNFVFYLLRDTTISFQTDPITDDCQISSSCLSFLLPGGLKAVAPWPYKVSTDKSLTVYITKDAPGYQIDVWDVPGVISWASDNCRVYGIDKGNAFQLCISSYNGRADQLVAGWRICPPDDVLPSGECNQTNSWASAYTLSSIIAINRRVATTAFDRFTSNILEIQSLGPPTAQEISPQNFSLAFDSMICPINSGSTLCTGNGVNGLLTTQIWFNILAGQDAATSTSQLDYLRNLFAAPLILFNPVTSGFGSLPSVDKVQPSLAPENYVNGSLARPITYVAPEKWTVYAYVGVASLLLGLAWVLLVWAMQYHPLETSAFAFVDFLRLRWKKNGSDNWNEGIQDVFLKEEFDKDKDMFKEVGDVKVKWDDNYCGTGIDIT